MADAKLFILNGPYDGATYDIARGSTLVSGASEAAVRMSCDPDFPSEGIRLTLDDNGLQYVDCRTQAILKLAAGAAFTVGQTQFVVHVQSGPQESLAERKETSGERTAK